MRPTNIIPFPVKKWGTKIRQSHVRRKTDSLSFLPNVTSFMDIDYITKIVFAVVNEEMSHREGLGRVKEQSRRMAKLYCKTKESESNAKAVTLPARIKENKRREQEIKKTLSRTPRYDRIDVPPEADQRTPWTLAMIFYVMLLSGVIVLAIFNGAAIVRSYILTDIGFEGSYWSSIIASFSMLVIPSFILAYAGKLFNSYVSPRAMKIYLLVLFTVFVLSTAIFIGSFAKKYGMQASDISLDSFLSLGMSGDGQPISLEADNDLIFLNETSPIPDDEESFSLLTLLNNPFDDWTLPMVLLLSNLLTDLFAATGAKFIIWHIASRRGFIRKQVTKPNPIHQRESRHLEEIIQKGALLEQERLQAQEMKKVLDELEKAVEEKSVSLFYDKLRSARNFLKNDFNY
jgi:phage-related holin